MMVLKVRIFNMNVIQTKSWDKAAKSWTMLFMKSLKLMQLPCLL